MKPSISYCAHILAEAEYIENAAAGILREDFLADETLKRAFVRSLEIIGEAVKQLPDDFRAEYPQVEWRKMAGTRDKLIHDYLGVDYELVWDIVQSKIPDLRKAMKEIMVLEKLQEAHLARVRASLEDVKAGKAKKFKTAKELVKALDEDETS
ncbi:MAG TPA: DUF86 domain-containing protein [Geobacteraceae bacterium]